MMRDQIQSILRQEYDQQRWLQVLREILPGTDVFASPQIVSVAIPDAPRAVQIARVRLGDRKQLAVLEVRVGDRLDLLRNRVGLRNLVVRFIDQAEYHGVLAVFLAPQSDFRFTFAARMAEFDEEGNLVRRETTPRRYTYVLGPNESCRTAAERFIHLSEKGLSATMEDVIEAFSVEKLNKEFFADFSAAFERVKTEIRKRNRWTEKTAKEEAQTLLNRLLFLYFVQRKGWLNRQRDYLFRNFNLFADDAPNKATFLDAFLRPLFTKLSTEGSQADISDHDLPFLNGGLFADEYGDEQHDEVVRRHHELQVSNEIFRSVFDDLLERYNFTIQEDSPTNYEVAIDPEMLGQIFEELVLTSEESETAGKSKRHDTGSHYTRRPIVHYLCRDSLAAWLESQPPFVGKDDAPQRVRKLLALDATEGIDEETRDALKEILTPEEAAVLLDHLFELRACDPAVGSGAFPMGLLHELVNLARLCATRAAGKDPVLGDRSWLYTTKKRIIERVIYGVDIQPQAVDICKLRLWLSLMVDYELSADPDNCEAGSFRKALKEIEPLPNLDFKIRRANSLVDYIHGEPVELKQLSSETGASLALSKLSAAKREFFNARTAAAKRKLRLTIYQNITELAKIELTRARMDAAGLGFALTDRDGERVAELDSGLKEIEFIAAQLRDARKMRAQDQEDALERIRTQFDDPDKPTFVWQFDFAEVFHRDETAHGDSLLPPEKPDKADSAGTRNGFDLAIGNPPYIRIQTLTKSDPKLAAYYKQRYQSAGKGNYDLYVCFVERGLELLHQNGQLEFIQPNKFFNAQYGEPNRELLAKGKHMRHVVHFGDQQIFPGATNYVCLLFLAKGGVSQCRFVQVDDFDLWLVTTAKPRTLACGHGVQIIRVGTSRLALTDLICLSCLRRRVRKNWNTSPQEFFKGLKTGADKVYIFEESTRTKDGCRVKCRQNDTEYVLETELLHPLIKGGDSHAYRLTHPDRVILFPYEKQDKGDVALIPASRLRKDFPNTWSYLKDHKDCLESRDGGEMAGEDWYGYSRAQALDLMSLPKLFTPDIAPVAGFSYDKKGKVFFTGGVAGGYGILASSPMTPEFLLSVLNSPVSDFFHHRIATKMRGGWFSYESRFIRNLPIPSASAKHQAVVESLVSYVLLLNDHSANANAESKKSPDAFPAAYFQQCVNALIYELFFPQELHAAGLHFFSLVEQAELPALNSIPDSERLTKLHALGELLNNTKHPLYAALYTLRGLEIVRIIEGEP